MFALPDDTVLISDGGIRDDGELSGLIPGICGLWNRPQHGREADQAQRGAGADCTR
jgi:hypothetical protein